MVVMFLFAKCTQQRHKPIMSIHQESQQGASFSVNYTKVKT